MNEFYHLPPYDTVMAIEIGTILMTLLIELSKFLSSNKCIAFLYAMIMSQFEFESFRHDKNQSPTQAICIYSRPGSTASDDQIQQRQIQVTQ